MVCACLVDLEFKEEDACSMPEETSKGDEVSPVSTLHGTDTS